MLILTGPCCGVAAEDTELTGAKVTMMHHAQVTCPARLSAGLSGARLRAICRGGWPGPAGWGVTVVDTELPISTLDLRNLVRTRRPIMVNDNGARRHQRVVRLASARAAHSVSVTLAVVSDPAVAARPAVPAVLGIWRQPENQAKKGDGQHAPQKVISILHGHIMPLYSLNDKHGAAQC